jgi:hypothetical protein
LTNVSEVLAASIIRAMMEAASTLKRRSTYIRLHGATLMEAAVTSETSVNFYQTTRRNNPEDIHLHTRRRVNLKSQIIVVYISIVMF